MAGGKLQPLAGQTDGHVRGDAGASAHVDTGYAIKAAGTGTQCPRGSQGRAPTTALLPGGIRGVLLGTSRGTCGDLQAPRAETNAVYNSQMKLLHKSKRLRGILCSKMLLCGRCTSSSRPGSALRSPELPHAVHRGGDDFPPFTALTTGQALRSAHRKRLSSR